MESKIERNVRNGTSINMPSIISNLQNPGSLPDKTDSISVVQTHISIVFVADEFVYKVKKPVNFGDTITGRLTVNDINEKGWARATSRIPEPGKHNRAGGLFGRDFMGFHASLGLKNDTRSEMLVLHPRNNLNNLAKFYISKKCV
jgi:hypothetical protein